MRKLRITFLLCLAIVFGLGSVQAQTGTFPRQYEQGEGVDGIVDGMEVVFCPDAGNYHSGQFFGADFNTVAGTEDAVVTSWSSDRPSGNSIFIIEEVGEFEDTFGSYTTYRLKNKATGYYVAAQHLVETGDVPVLWTNDPKKAFVCTILHTVGPNDVEGANPRETAAPEGNNANTVPNLDSWILTDTADQNEAVDENDRPLKALYLCAWGDHAMLSQYADTNQWSICNFSETTEYRDALSQMIFNIYSSVEDIVAMFPVGTTPGTYTDAVALQALIDLFLEFEEWSGQYETASYEECEAMFERFVTARARLDASEVKFQAGHYYAFISVKNGGVPYIRKAPTGANGSWVGADVHTFGDKITADDAQYIWTLEDAGDGYFYIRGYTTGKYPVFPSSKSIRELSDTPVDGAIYAIEVSPYTAERCFMITSKNVPGKGWNVINTGTEGIGAWGSFASDPGSNWRVLEISEEAIKEIEDDIAQKELNDELAEIYPKASALYNKGRVYSSDEAANDGVFSTPADGFVTNASQLWSNAPESSEGPVDDLLDGDFQTYFHSAWTKVPADIKYHTLEVDLGSAQQTIAMKYARRCRGITGEPDGPKTFNFYATNDTTTATGKWDYIGSYEFTYTASVMAPRSVKAEDKENIVEYPNSAGMVGMDMKAPYRYIRIEVTDNLRSNKAKVFFNLGEFRVYTGKFDADASTAYNRVPEDIRNAFEAALDAATPQYLNGTATKEAVDELNATYEAFRAAYPDEQRALDAIAAAKTEVSGYNSVVGEGIGMFPTEAKENFDATMTTIEEAVNSNMTVEEISELVARAEKAVADFMAALQIPEAGKIYAIRGMTSEKLGHNALITDNSNDYNTGLVYTVDTLDVQVDPATALNYLWKVEKSSLEEGLVLRNLATGYYMDTTVVLNRGIRTVAEPSVLGIRSAKVAHGLNIIVGATQDGGAPLYANFAGGRTSIVAWNSASGTDNSCLTFEEVYLPEDEAEYNVNWPIAAGKPNILTLPFSIYYTEDEYGNKAYSVLGEKATTEDDVTTYTLELKEMEEGEIAAGRPFVVLGAEEAPYFRMCLMECCAYDIPYAKETVSQEGDIIMGTMGGVLLDWDQVGLLTFRNGNANFIISSQEERTRISGNSGYIRSVATEETGDVSLELRRSIASGIEDAVVADENATVDVYTVSGVQVRKTVKAAGATAGLPTGLYIVGGKKVLVK